MTLFAIDFEIVMMSLRSVSLTSYGTCLQICKEAEAATYHTKFFEELLRATPKPTDTAHTIAIAATSAAVSCHASAILLVTTTGRYALFFLYSNLNMCLNAMIFQSYVELRSLLILSKILIPLFLSKVAVHQLGVFKFFAIAMLESGRQNSYDV